MEASKAAARQFVENQPSGVSIGVVVFSDGGISVQAPTDNREETLATIDRLVPRRGTSIGNGILVALNAIVVDAGDPPILNTNSTSADPSVPLSPVETPQGWYPSAAIVLLTDGENNQEPDPVTAAQLAADLGVRVYTVGIGSPEGADLEVEGFTVHTSLDEPTLQYIASETGGAYYNAGNEEQLRQIYDDLKPRLSIKPEQMELTSILAGIGMVIFLIGGLLSLLWFGHVPCAIALIRSVGYVDDSPVARFSPSAVIDPGGDRGLSLDSAPAQALCRALFEPLAGARGGGATIVAAQTSAFRSFPGCIDEPGPGVDPAGGNRAGPLQQGDRGPGCGCLAEYVLHRYPAQPVRGCQAGGAFLRP
jgi:hypothetical protein